MSRDRGLARRAANSARARASTSNEPWAQELRRLAGHVDRLAAEPVVSIDDFRNAKAALEVTQDLESVAATYGYELTVLFTAAGVSARLERDGRRHLDIQPCRNIHLCRDHVMTYLAAQELSSQ
ncbi:hypothetical protein JTZ10_21505 [Gordonia rubripertincta]|uniref:Uncharacterized protein n=1 Tax=Gordonia rubripertincta TaxID=36822 RepID=A0AAW4GAG9_GORRU|nr:hypothetical protein [Gordonia rubripertincta]MBM7280324.1 hypothetical protein [Gordonia rubripertincta]